MPVGIDIDQGYGDLLWGKNAGSRMSRRPASSISNENTAYTQIGFDNAVARATPVFARFRDSGRTVAGAGPAYRVKDFTYGLTLAGLDGPGTYQTRIDQARIPALPRPLPPAIPVLPDQKTWVNVHRLGVKGDGITDDTAALQRAIDAHRVLYLPIGFYPISDHAAAAAGHGTDRAAPEPHPTPAARQSARLCRHRRPDRDGRGAEGRA